MPIRKHKKYNRPRKIFDIVLIKEENKLIKKYGLKNRREVWKANYAIGKIRNLAKELITASEAEKNKFVERQRAKGFAVNSIADVLGLSKEDYLKRRLESILVLKGITKTHKQARQFITHKHVKLKGNFINAPGHLTTVDEEATIELDLQMPATKTISDEDKEILKQMHKENKSDEAKA